MNKEKWQKIDREEQDYDKKEVNFYTSREAVYKRILKILGNPTKTFYTKGLITGVNWSLSFDDKKTSKLFSKKLLIRKFKIKYYFKFVVSQISVFLI